MSARAWESLQAARFCRIALGYHLNRALAIGAKEQNSLPLPRREDGPAPCKRIQTALRTFRAPAAETGDLEHIQSTRQGVHGPDITEVTEVTVVTAIIVVTGVGAR